MLFCKAYLPTELDLPQAVQCNADGDRVIIEVWNGMDQTCQVVFSNDEHGDLVVSLRGWGNKPMSLGNMDRTSFQATIPLEPATTSLDRYYRILAVGEWFCHGDQIQRENGSWAGTNRSGSKIPDDGHRYRRKI